ncbi:MAG TPA: hypothetical protein VM734_04785 [Kofleriaceae bacterium]|nr:hypothetical protein [Kofleriaceae bacterium]
MVHQKNLSTLTTQQREWEIQIAEESLAGLERQRVATEARREYVQGQIDTDLIDGESVQLSTRELASEVQLSAAAVSYIAGSLGTLVQGGSPFALTYGGIQLKEGPAHAVAAMQAVSQSLDIISGVAGMQAGFERRREGWRHQRDQLVHELAVLDRNLVAARKRVDLARRSLVVHEEGIAQIDEVLAVMDNRFTGRGLYTYLAQTLGRLYREAYLGALGMARLAQAAYRFERGGDAPTVLSASHWEPGKAGLLAGERLLIELQHLERRFLETNHRDLEIDQPVSLSQLDAAALVRLRQTGACEFTIPEQAFDVAYPGHWRRRLRAVRLTIPCVTPSYTNVSATLTLLGSQVRPTPTGALETVPLSYGTTIATSTAQADGGVFELSFRDERYLPFEGQGAVSTWRLELPSTICAFDYQSITDVVISLAYSARPDADRRKVLEATNGAAGSLLEHYQDNPTLQVVSLRQDLGASFLRLLRAAPGTPVGFQLDEDKLPAVYRRRTIAVHTGTPPLPSGIALRLAPGLQPGSEARLAIDGAVAGELREHDSLPGLWLASVAWPATMSWTQHHTVAVTNAGSLGGEDTLDPDKVLDVLLVLPIKLAAQ